MRLREDLTACGILDVVAEERRRGGRRVQGKRVTLGATYKGEWPLSTSKKQIERGTGWDTNRIATRYGKHNEIPKEIGDHPRFIFNSILK